jgi:molybdopterin molybdotransferase
VLIELAAAPGEHIRRRAEEYRRGDPLLPAGTRITPPVVGLLANFGHGTVVVHRRPAVGLVTIGDELAAPGERLAAGQIHNSNEPALLASLQELGLARVAARVVRDDPAALRRALRTLLARSDVVITAGGASVGDHDHVRGEAVRAGVREIFRRVAVKPGKPTYFGTVPGRRRGAGGSRHRLFFGLPGNPVSALVCFQLFVRPALLRMMGLAEVAALTLRAELAEECRKAPERLEWLRGRLEFRDGVLRVVPSKRQGSHMLGGLATADCLIRFPRTATRLAAGEEVEVRLLPW